MLQIKLKNERLVRVKDVVADYPGYVWCIEHESRGLFSQFGHAPVSDTWGPRWKRGDTITRRSEEVWKTSSLDELKEMMARVVEHVPDAYVVQMLRERK